MRVAIARTGNEAAQHFGYCDNFMIYDIEENKVIKQEVLSNPGHQPGLLPRLLKENNVDVIIAGGMGRKAKEIFQSYSIKTITGLTGTIDDILESFLNDTLVSTNETCNHEHHEHH